MRFLKNKIARAQELMVSKQDKALVSSDKDDSKKHSSPTTTNPHIDSPEDNQPKKRRRLEGSYITSQRARSTKNVVKNFGKAICSFATSDLALPYLNPMIEANQVRLTDFVQFVSDNKETIESIQSFRSVLLVNDDDPLDIQCFRRILASIGEVFIKYFSVNWIFSGRVTHKEAHLKFRFKMLRRIKNPENFTYIQKAYRRKSKT